VVAIDDFPIYEQLGAGLKPKASSLGTEGPFDRVEDGRARFHPYDHVGPRVFIGRLYDAEIDQPASAQGNREPLFRTRMCSRRQSLSPASAGTICRTAKSRAWVLHLSQNAATKARRFGKARSMPANRHPLRRPNYPPKR
jgi:hypothetical protein